MRGLGNFGRAMLAAAACMAAPAMSAQLTPSPQQLLAIEERQRQTPVQKKKANRGLAENTPRWKRSRGAQAKPKKRPNRLTISKRVRRKHRRAA